LAVIGFELNYGLYYVLNGDTPECLPIVPDALQPLCRPPFLGFGLVAGGSQTVQVDPRSADPNDIVGPAGFGPQGFLAPQVTLPYVIHFENAPSAADPAGQVIVTEQVDADLDLTTFELGDFGFGDLTVPVPTGRQFYHTRVDLRALTTPARQELFVDVTAELNRPTRTVSWTFTSLDPSTLDLPSDPHIGFLPPDKNAPEGQGFVTYFVSPRRDARTGTRLEAQASIVFDNNAPILTNVFTNTIDAGLPSSSVNPLPAVTTTASFTVGWSGVDDADGTPGAGIASLDVFVADTGGPFQLLLDDTQDTSVTFHGEDGHTYRFYSVATDNLGRVESAPASPDAETTVTVALPRAPVLDPIGGRRVEEETLLTFAVTASDPDGGMLVFSLDPGAPAGAAIDGATGVFTWTPGEADGHGVFAVTIRVSDDSSPALSDAETIQITVDERNAAPSARLSGPLGGVRGQILAFTGEFSDADALDTHEVAVDWGDGSGMPFRPSTDPGALDLSHAYTGLGDFTVTWTVRDENGAVGSASRTVTIGAVALQPDPGDPARTALMVGGTTSNDVIKFSKDRSGGVKVVLNRVTLGVFAPTGRVVAFGLGGDDDISVAGVTLPVEFYGGEGNDKLKAGKGSAILVGGPGDDKLTGGAARDLLIGGGEADRLAGAGEDDILVAGRTVYDDQPEALRAVMAEWARTDLTYAERVAHLQNGGGRNNQVRLAPTDDAVKDQLSGGGGLDWFLAATMDKVSGRRAPEILVAESRPSLLAIAWSSSSPAGNRITKPFGASARWVPEFAIDLEESLVDGLGVERLAERVLSRRA
jgi:Ca2+-binding RTX toxin-like protein